MNQILDQNDDLSSQLEEIIQEYWPDFKSGKIGRTEIRKELNTRLKEDGVQYVLDELSDRHLNGYAVTKTEVTAHKTREYLFLTIGVVLIITGLVFTIMLWQLGGISKLFILMIAGGIGIVFRSNKKLNSIKFSDEELIPSTIKKNKDSKGIRR